jgi:hypothetical protein
VSYYAEIFWQLIKTPFLHVDLVWGIVPLYFGWILNELTSPKASFQTAVQTGFSFLWAAAHWGSQYLSGRSLSNFLGSGASNLLAVNIMVTLIVFILGALALIFGVRKKFPPCFSFLGHSRFSNYFMIAIFPIQSNNFTWSWDRVLAIVLFAPPVWLLFHYGLMPWRK